MQSNECYAGILRGRKLKVAIIDVSRTTVLLGEHPRYSRRLNNAHDCPAKNTARRPCSDRLPYLPAALSNRSLLAR